MTFFLTLPSNTSPENKTGNFRVRLPERIRLSGDWEVALVELLYPYSWNNVHDSKESYDMYQNSIGLYMKNGTVIYMRIEPGHYETIQQLEDVIEDAIVAKIREIRTSDDGFNTLLGDYPEFSVVQLKFDYIKRKMDLHMNNGLISGIVLSKHLAYVLGFKDEVLTTEKTAEHPIDLRGGTDALYVYSNIVENQIVGNTRVPLLRIVHVHGHHGDVIEKTFHSPHYIPVLCKEIDNIEVEIKSDSGHLIPFEYGKTVAKLHFRKKRMLL